MKNLFLLIINVDSNKTIDRFRLEWDNELNDGVKYPYPSFDSSHDLENDSLGSMFEFKLRTNPFYSDTDRDGWSDGEEWKCGIDPLDANDYPFKTNKMLQYALIGGTVVTTVEAGIIEILVIKRRQKEK
ncbi:MAG: thrombospondin type 3 repeat-containing protein [Candidatus Heimdallarchaeota archaeon]